MDCVYCLKFASPWNSFEIEWVDEGVTHTAWMHHECSEREMENVNAEGN